MGASTRPFATYQQAIAEQPKGAGRASSRSRTLEADRGDKALRARTSNRRCRSQKAPAEVEQTTRTLDDARSISPTTRRRQAHHEALVKRRRRLALRASGARARALSRAASTSAPRPEFREVVKVAAGDNRALAPGAARSRAGARRSRRRWHEALEHAQAARSPWPAAPPACASEILVHHDGGLPRRGKLSELITLLEAEKPGRTSSASRMMASLVRGDRRRRQGASRTYRKALAIDSRADRRARQARCTCSQTAGELDAAIQEYEAPHPRGARRNPDFVFELCETLIQRGDRPKALKLLERARGSRTTSRRARRRRRLLRARAKRRTRRSRSSSASPARRRRPIPTTSSISAIATTRPATRRRRWRPGPASRPLVPNTRRARPRSARSTSITTWPRRPSGRAARGRAARSANVRYKKSLATALERTAPALARRPRASPERPRAALGRAARQRRPGRQGAGPRVRARTSSASGRSPASCPRRSRRCTSRFNGNAAQPRGRPPARGGAAQAPPPARRRGHAPPRRRARARRRPSRCSPWSACSCSS